MVPVNRSGGQNPARSAWWGWRGGLILAATAVEIVAGLGFARPSTPLPHTIIPPDTPRFRIIEGQAHSPNPYSPAVLTIPAQRVVAVSLTDYLGGCGLVTVFPKLAVPGGTARLRVPVGATQTIALRASAPGRYVYHCASNMYFGTIVAVSPKANAGRAHRGQKP